MTIVIIDKKVHVKAGRCTYLEICDEEQIKDMSVNDFATLVQHRMAESDYKSVQSAKGLQVN